MQNIIDKVKNQIITACGLDVPITLEVPRDKNFGAYSTNVAMQLAKQRKQNPRELAQSIVDNMKLDGTYIEKAEVAGPGFINFYLKNSWLNEVVPNVLEMGENYGSCDVGAGKSVVVEYVSANPTGPMHMGNARGGALGDSLARTLKMAGFNVTREFYLNDAGNQILKLGNSLYARYMQQFGDYPFPEDGYHGNDITKLAKDYIEEFGNDNDDVQNKLVAFALERNVAQIEKILAQYRVEYDVWYKESELYSSGAVDKIVEKIKASGATYENEGALWLKCGDKDEVLVRANGVPTYFTADIAYHYNKLAERNFDRAINVWGADHHGHIARMKNALEILGIHPNRLEVITIQLVRLMRGGEVARMSKRSGESITLVDLLDEIGIDAARFFFNMRLANSHFDFDLELAVKQSSDNPVYYVQYAYARICSILASAGCRVQSADISYSEDAEFQLLRKIAQFPQEVAVSAQTLEPSRLTHYASALAAEFHSFYSACKVMVDDEKVRNSRLLLIESARQTLGNVLGLLGVSAPERM